MPLIASPGFIGRRGGPATVSFASSAVSAANQTTYTFSGLALGAAAANRKIVVAATANTETVSTITVAGISATLQVAEEPNFVSEIWLAAVPTGTTGDVVVTWTGAVFRCGVGVWATYDMSSTLNDSAVSTSGNPTTASINCPAGGVVIAGVYVNTVADTGPPTFTWTNLTEGYDEGIEDSKAHTGAATAFATEQTGLTVTATPSETTTTQSLSVVSWGPG